MRIVINPGSGPVPGATLENAKDNIRHFLTDLNVRRVKSIHLKRYDEDGRCAFLLWKENRCCLIEMPGLPLSRVRFIGKDGQDPWDYPRLYVDGSSWLWTFAVDIAKGRIENKGDE